MNLDIVGYRWRFAATALKRRNAVGVAGAGLSRRVSKVARVAPSPAREASCGVGYRLTEFDA
jgi:hypothetical protein